MPPVRLLLVFQDQSLLDVISRAVLIPAEFQFNIIQETGNLSHQISEFMPDLIILEHTLAGENLAVAAEIRRLDPAIAVLLFTHEINLDTALNAVRVGIADVLVSPVKTRSFLQSIQDALDKQRALARWKARQPQRSAQQEDEHSLDELDALERVGRSVTTTFNIDNLLDTAVESAVELTQAEEGSLMLLDPETNEFSTRSVKNRAAVIVQTRTLPISDTLAREVIREGKPLRYPSDELPNLKNENLLYSLMYVPLRTHSGVIGVLGVQNRQKKVEFSQSQQAVVTAIADYAAIAIENTRLFNKTEIERRKLNTILTKIVDGVIVVDHDRNVIMVNPTAREAFDISSQNLVGRSIYEVVKLPELLKIFSLRDSLFPLRREIALDDGRVFNVQATAIPEVGLTLTMQDITRIKEIDRIKSDFVSTVSHDLRSPLTAILGYVELLERVGPLTDTQKQFVQRVHASVQNITNLINELLDLGRIEAGFDVQREYFALETLILLVVEDLREAADEKSQAILLDVPPDLPDIFASPTRIQQLLSNLISNAIKYTQRNGWVRISVQAENDQLILQVQDNGPGILITEQPYIFDRFYRASNVDETGGTGLGLAIVKSIVENHQGRVWVDSTPGKGTTFTVMLPVMPGLDNIQRHKINMNPATQD